MHTYALCFRKPLEDIPKFSGKANIKCMLKCTIKYTNNYAVIEASGF